MMRMKRVVLAACFLFALHASAQVQNPPVDGFSWQLEKGLQHWIDSAAEFETGYPKSNLPRRLSKIAIDNRDELMQYDAHLRQQNISLKERTAKMRKRYLAAMRRIHELKPKGGYQVRYHERESAIEVIFQEIRSDGNSHSYSKKGSPVLLQLLEIPQSYDAFTSNLDMALQDIDLAIQQAEKAIAVGESMNAFHKPSSASGWVGKSNRYFPDFLVAGILEEIKYELIKADIEMADQNLSDEERIARLRDRFLDVAAKYRGIEPFVEYDEAALRINFSNSRSEPIVQSGKRLGFDLPFTLVAFLNAQPYAKARADARAKARGIRGYLTIGGAAAVVLLLFGTVYFTVKFRGRRADAG